MKILFRVIAWLFRIVLIIWLLLAWYLAYQKLFNNTNPKQAIESLISTSEQSIESMTNTVKETTSSLAWSPQVCYNNDCYTVEVVDTPTSRQKWLMFREELAQNAGMLFIFDTPSNYNFWMKNTKLSLDIIRLDKEYTILHINANTPPCTSNPCPTYWPEQWSQALYVLEINSGEANNRTIGDTVQIKNL